MTPTTTLPKDVTHFKLKNARSYRFWNRGGLRMLDLRAGQVVRINKQDDITYFRGRPDVVVECGPDGVPLGGAGRGQIDVDRTKSYRRYGRAAPPAIKPAAPQAAPQPVPTSAVYAPLPASTIESAREQAAALPPIPADPMADVALPRSRARSVPDEGAVLQAQRIASGFAPDPSLPPPPSVAFSPMVQALEKSLADNPEQEATLRPLLEQARQAAMNAHVQANPIAAPADPYRASDAPRRALLDAVQAEQRLAASPIEFANPDGGIDVASPGR